MEGGYRISARVAKDRIGETDKYGGMIVDAIYRGIAEVLCTANGIEWTAGLLAALFPYGAAVPVSGAAYVGPGVIGRLDSDVAGVMILTAASSTPAAAKPASVTATYAIITEQAAEIILDSKLRKLPGQWQFLPYDDSGTVKIFTAT